MKTIKYTTMKKIILTLFCFFTFAVSAYGQLMYLGIYALEADAALAYNQAAIRLHGKFATLNDIQYE